MNLKLVCFHAFPLDGRMWGAVKAAAAAGPLGEGVSVTAPDFRGRGASGLPAERTHPKGHRLMIGALLARTRPGQGA